MWSPFIHGRSDRNDQPDHPRMGKLLLSLPCQKALPSAGRLDNPTAVVTPHQAMAQRSVEGISQQTVAHGVQAGQPRRTHTFAADRESPFMKAGYGKTVCPVCAADGGKLFIGRLLRPDSWEADEQSGAIRRGAGGAKGRDRGECGQSSTRWTQIQISVSQGVGSHTARFAVDTRGGSRMRESRTYGSVRVAPCKRVEVCRLR